MKRILLIAYITSMLLTAANAQVGEMVQVGDIYVDKYEAPNIPGELPFVMFSYLEAKSWCEARGKRLLFDDEWELAAGGPLSLSYVYGTTYDSSVCNDFRTWLTYNQTLINQWPNLSNLNNFNSFSELIDSVINISSSAAQSANHIMFLYQADSAGSNSGCVSYFGVFDMNGNVEEWTTRRDGGTADFHGNLKGGYWSEHRTIQSNRTAHGDYYRFYQTGFRCALDSANLSIQSLNNTESFSVYPNPATDHLIIETTNNFTHPVSIEIYNSDGRRIENLETRRIENSKLGIDISIWNPGIYFGRIIFEKGNCQGFRFVIQ